MLTTTPRERVMTLLLQQALIWVDGCRNGNIFTCKCDHCQEAADLYVKIDDILEGTESHDS